MKLQIRNRRAGMALDERAGLEHRSSEPAVSDDVLPEHAAKKMRRSSAVEAGAGPEHQRHQEMVVQVLAHAGQVLPHLDAVLAEMVRGPDSREHEQLRRANRASG